MKWGILGVGAGLITSGILLNVRGLKQTKRAVNSYNSLLGATTMNKSPLEFTFGINQNGVGLRFMF
jgi:hypothetical protein